MKLMLQTYFKYTSNSITIIPFHNWPNFITWHIAQSKCESKTVHAEFFLRKKSKTLKPLFRSHCFQLTAYLVIQIKYPWLNHIPRSLTAPRKHLSTTCISFCLRYEMQCDRKVQKLWPNPALRCKSNIQTEYCRCTLCPLSLAKFKIQIASKVKRI